MLPFCSRFTHALWICFQRSRCQTLINSVPTVPAYSALLLHDTNTTHGSALSFIICSGGRCGGWKRRRNQQNSIWSLWCEEMWNRREERCWLKESNNLKTSKIQDRTCGSTNVWLKQNRNNHQYLYDDCKSGKCCLWVVLFLAKNKDSD